MQTISLIVQLPKAAFEVAVARAAIDKKRLCFRWYKQCSLWGLHSLLGDESYHREVRSPKPEVDLRGVLGSRLSALFRGNSLFLLAKYNLTLVQWATASKLVRKVKKMQLHVWGPFSFAQAAGTFISLSRGERLLRLGQWLSNFPWGCDILAL